MGNKTKCTLVGHQHSQCTACARIGYEPNFNVSVTGKGVRCTLRGKESVCKSLYLEEGDIDWIRRNNLYRLHIDSPMVMIGINNNSGKEMNELWHRRMGHLHHGALKILKETVTGVPKLGTEHDNVCRGCVLGKYAKVAFPRNVRTYTFRYLWPGVH